MVLATFVISIFVFLLLGVPIAFSILMTIVVLVTTSGISSYAIVPTYLYSGVNSFSLMAIPFFTLCGELMNAGNLSQGIVDFCRCLLGHIKAGLGYAAILACMLFACLSGAAVITVSAIGGIMLPLLIQEGYDSSDSTAVVCAGSITGPIIPPSIPMVVYGVISGVSVTKMFVAGVIPGLLMGFLCMFTWWLMNRNKNYPVQPKATPRQLAAATKKAFPALMMPIIMMGGILSGIFTPTEAGVVACVYAYLVSKFLYKKMSFADLKKAVLAAAKSSAVVMFVVASTQALGMVITVARIPQMIAEAINSVSSNPYVIMCLIDVFILGVGLFMDVVPALTIVAPIFLPIATGVGMDPIVFGMTMIFGLVIGLITPPVGNVLYIGCGISKIPLLSLLKRIYPMVIVYIVILFLITFCPGLITFLPNLVMT